MRTYGSARLVDGVWHIKAEPHVLMRLRRVFEGISKHAVGEVTISHTPEHCQDLVWFCQRYPLDVSPVEALRSSAQQHEEHITRIADLLAVHHQPPVFNLAFPPRPYQAIAAELYLATGGLLVADDLGLGKTVEAIAAFTDPSTLPALVVCPSHLVGQWIEAVKKFAPNLMVSELKTMTPTPLPSFLGRGPDVLVTSYHRLSGWAQVVGEYCHSVVFDEVHELRHPDSGKYKAAQYLAPRLRRRMGLSATPIYNYGGEMFWVLSILKPGCLGTHSEFLREWCSHSSSTAKARLAQPELFGTYLREQGLMLRRTRAEVGRELPPVTRVVHTVDSDPAALQEVEGVVRELARILLNQTAATRQERFEAGGQLDWRMRQATGLAKSTFVASFVQMLVEGGEPVLLAGWHRAVFDVWNERLTAAGVRVGFYTGTETPAAKAETKRAFLAGELDVVLISLRSGAGLDGLQECCSVIVHGELDWSPSVHDQLTGRVDRDGQAKPVVAYYLVAEDGSDPVVAEVLGLKRDQLEGIRNPGRDAIEPLGPADGEHVKRLAEACLTRPARGYKRA